jgi:hypothetical protein
MNKNGLVYLASPYSHPDPAVMESRYLEAVKAAHYLMSQGHVVFSPIAHNHILVKMFGLPVGWEYWEKFDSVYLRMSSQLIILTLDGWMESKGIKGELKIAGELQLPLDYLSMAEVNGGI